MVKNSNKYVSNDTLIKKPHIIILTCEFYANNVFMLDYAVYCEKIKAPFSLLLKKLKQF